MIQIKNKYTQEIIHEGDFKTAKDCVEDAVQKGISLACANLACADLENANLENANLINANLEDAKMPNKPVILPPVGETIIGFKKLKHDVVIKVEVPADADRVSTWINRKCRASALRVIEVISNPNNIPTDCMPGWRHSTFIYKLGELYFPHEFDSDERDDCRPGLHFFMTPEEAMDW